ncbi:MAG TPA: hypothetical protein VHO02_04850, partial [Fibrobacteria bacterium]|nr:hypothetical protein [Fibrobacteria bacterium]
MLWMLVVLAGLLILLFAALGAAGWWLEHRYLRRELHFGPDRAIALRVHGATFKWLALDLRADSVRFRSPALDAYSGPLEAGVDWRGGLLAFRPAARVKADTIFLRLRADTTEKKPLDPDSLEIPEFSLPLGVSLRVKHFAMADDSGFMVGADGVSARAWGEKARARAARVRTRWTDTLGFSARASFDGLSRDSVRARATVRHDSDRVAVEAVHVRRPLWKGRNHVAARVRDAAPYLAAVGIREKLPTITRIALNADATLDDTVAFTARLDARTGSYRVSDELTVGPQSVRLAADWRGRRGNATLRSDGSQGEKVALDAQARLLTLKPGVPIQERAALSLRGRATGFRVAVRDTLRRADLVVSRADWDGGRLALAVSTGDSSRARGEATLRGPSKAWRGTFAVSVAPEERWVKAFVGDAVSFRALEARGAYARRTLKAEAAARGVAAYGVTLDSLRSFHTYGPSGYVLEPSRLHARGIEWTLSGNMRPASRPGRPPAFAAELSAPDHGKLRVAGEDDGTLKAEAGLFDVGALPYAPLDSLPIKKPVLDGTFEWNPARKTGAADLAAQAEYNREPVEARVKGDWDPKTLRLENVAGKIRASEARVSAELRLRGKQFWELHRVPPADYTRAELSIPRMDLAEVLGVFIEDPPLESGNVRGSLAYADSQGFEGSLVFSKVVPRDAVGDVTLKELRLDGDGDTLTVVARTESESNALYNAKLRAGVTGALKEEQRVTADLVAGDSLRVRLEALTQRFRSLKGSLTASGRADLPENSGVLSNIRLALDFDVPTADPLKKSVARTRAFEAGYAPPGMAKQDVSLSASVGDGMLRVDSLRVRDGTTNALNGSLEYALTNGALHARLQGDRFAAQWTKSYKFDLHALRLEVTRDDKGLRASGGFAEGSFLFANSPLRAEGRLGRVDASYSLPPARAAG